MLDLLKLASEGTGWISAVAGFVALPAIYLVLAIDVHKDYAELVKTTSSMSIRDDQEAFEGFMARVSDGLYLFELDWWAIVLVAALLLGILNLGSLVKMSKYLDTSCNVLSTTETAKSTSSAAKHSGDAHERKTSSDCRMASTIVNVFGLMVVLGACFYLGWARMLAARNLREYYGNLNLIDKT